MPIHDWTRVIPGAFHDFHVEWMTSIKHALNRGLLPSNYYAMAEQVTGYVAPDVLTLERPARNGTKKPPTTRGIALADAPPKVHYRAKSELEIFTRKASTIVIRHASDHDVVAMIEIVSKGNKNQRQRLGQFLEKVHAILQEGINLMVIDLYPPNRLAPQGIHHAIWEQVTGIDSAGAEDFALPKDKKLTIASYIGGTFPETFVEPTAVGLPLPDMPLFLTPAENVNVPLERTYETAFQEVPEFYREQLDRPAKSARRRHKK